MGTLLGALLVVAWIATGVALVGAGAFYLWRYVTRREYDWAIGSIFAIGSLVGGLALLLLLGALATGDITVDGVRDGCYHVYRVSGGKTSHLEYDPIECPAWLK